jgi:hypothetical protein
MKIVINACHGGFGLSEKALEIYRKEVNDTEADEWDIPRDHPVLVRLVQELRDEVNTRFSELKVVEIPDGIEWTICEYDGLEWVAEAHRTWS